MRKVIDYMILEYDDKYELEDKVKEWLEKGCELYGSFMVHYDRNFKKRLLLSSNGKV